jgi:hypothetical protein
VWGEGRVCRCSEKEKKGRNEKREPKVDGAKRTTVEEGNEK